MPERVLITFVIVGGLGLLWLAWQYYKTKLIQTIRPIEPLNGKPTLLYFTADYCVVCKAQQTPILKQVAAKLGDSIAIKQYDVSRHPALVNQYKVLTLPTTIILNPHGQVTHINYGVTQQTKLEAQL
jgi:thiol-disulfide isomerase/thioredoxin